VSIWIFSNKFVGEYEDSDWDTSTILKRKRYYFKASEPNRTRVAAGDRAILREYGAALWGLCEVAGEWVDDPEAKSKHETEAGWFPIAKIQKWGATLPYELVKEDLSNQNHRIRIAKATEEDLSIIQLALRIYQRLGYGATDGDFFVLEAGIEEAVKANLKQLRLRLADESI
jgi:hypothetical protein